VVRGKETIKNTRHHECTKKKKKPNNKGYIYIVLYSIYIYIQLCCHGNKKRTMTLEVVGAPDATKYRIKEENKKWKNKKWRKKKEKLEEQEK